MQEHMKQRAYFKEYEVHYYEIDYRNKLLITSLLDYLGDIAIYHSNSLGVGIEYLRENKLAWVLYSWDINVKRFPSLGEKITIKTEPQAFKKFYAYRTFEVMDAEGNIIATAGSIWFLISLERKRPVRIMEKLYETYGIDENDQCNIELLKVEKLSKIDGEQTFSVRYSDIDTNRHVNNAKYAAWAIESVPLEIVTDYSLKALKANYEKEAHYGDSVKAVIEVRKTGNEAVCLHKILDAEEKELTLFSTVWAKD